MKIEIRKEIVSLESFKTLRKSVGWPLPPDRSIEKSLSNTEYCVTAYVDSEIVGMGRIVGDKGFIYFIADVIVKPAFQGKKIGAKIMNSIMLYLEENAPENSYITLMAAKGKEEFYEKFGFFKRPTEKYGCGMMIELR
ncbi:MAG: GNAT family N-acetyltransferase [Syntrophaceae bacterium]|nr:GNAT family N-acetyltransferase [Syntrophaceae bacterium]